MIGRLHGVIIEKQPPLLILDVSGVGYEVYAPMSTFYHLPALNQTTTLLTQLIVREDAQLLYGFYQTQERDLFRALIKVNGVGPKLALTILSGIQPDEFVACVQNNDISRLVLIPGIGKKTAERLIMETRDPLADWSAALESQQPNNLQDAISALTALGYKPQEASRVVKKVYQEGQSREALIRSALQHMTAGVAA